jgi:DNA-binding response OmpR family regulator
VPTVFIVDDDKDMANAVRMMFRLLRFEGTTFHNARDLASHMLASPNLPDLLLVDMSMPEVNGMDVVRWIRRSHKFKNIPIIILSAEIHPELVKDAIAAGANDYLFKPILLEDLEVALTRVFGKS